MATNWVEFSGLKIVKYIAIIIVILLGTTVIMGLFTNRSIKLWGLEFNNKEYVVKHDTVTIFDTIVVRQFLKNVATVPNKKIITQNNQNGKNEINDNHGTNYGAIGGSNNTVNNQFGPKQRLVTDSILRLITQHIPNKSTQIVIKRRTSDSESEKFGNSIVKALEDIGYTSVFLFGIQVTQVLGGNPDQNLKESKQFQFSLFQNQASILLPNQ